MKYIIQIADDSPPGEKTRYQNMLKIDDWIGVVQDIDNELRQRLKYENKPAAIQQELMEIRGLLFESMNERLLDFPT